jgi:hypothetical protein
MSVLLCYICANEIADKPARGDSAQRFVGPDPIFGGSRQNIRRKMKRWIEIKYLALRRGPCSTQGQTRELISGPDLAMGARLLSFNPLNAELNPICLSLILLGDLTFMGLSIVSIFQYIFVRHPQLTQTGSNSSTIAADSSNGVTNTRCCKYSCMRS